MVWFGWHCVLNGVYWDMVVLDHVLVVCALLVGAVTMVSICIGLCHGVDDVVVVVVLYYHLVYRSNSCVVWVVIAVCWEYVYCVVRGVVDGVVLVLVLDMEVYMVVGVGGVYGCSVTLLVVMLC